MDLPRPQLQTGEAAGIGIEAGSRRPGTNIARGSAVGVDLDQTGRTTPRAGKPRLFAELRGFAAEDAACYRVLEHKSEFGWPMPSLPFVNW